MQTANHHLVSPSSLEPLIVATELQNGAANLATLRSTAVYRGVQLLADLAGSIPWYANEGGDPALTGQRTIVRPERLAVQPTILVRPNAWEDRDETIRKFVQSLIWHGNAYVLGSLFVEGRPTHAMVLDPNEVTVTPSERDRTRGVYSWRGQTLTLGGNLWHTRLVTLPGQIVGTSPLRAAMGVIDGAIAADQYANQFFRESATPAGTLTSMAMLTKPEAEELRDQWEEQHRLGRGTAVLGGGITYEQISVTPEQAQFLQTRAFGNQEIARLLGVPQWLLNAGSPPGSGSSLTYSNLSAVFIELTRMTLDPTYLRRLQAVFSQFIPRGQAVDFDLLTFTRADPDARARTAEIAIRSGWLDPVEVRIAEGLPAVFDNTVRRTETEVSI